MSQMTNLTHKELVLLDKILLRYQAETTGEADIQNHLYLKLHNALRKEETK